MNIKLMKKKISKMQVDSLKILAESLYSLAGTGLTNNSLISTPLPPTAIRTSTRPKFASMLSIYEYNKVTNLIY